MKTLRYKIVDGKTIFTGFDKIKVDGNATRRKVLKKIVNESIYAEVQVLGVRIEELKNSKKTEFFKEEIKKARKAHKSKSKVLEERLLELFDDEKTLFPIRKNELIPSKKLRNKIKNLKKNLGADHLIEIIEDDAQEVLNLVDKKYFIEEDGKYISKKINSLGEAFPEGHVFELNKSQLNTNSDGNLKENHLKQILSESALKKIELEITGKTSSEALAEARAWYDQEVIKVDALYQ